MRHILNVNIPKSWQELPDRELRFVFRLLQGEYPLPKIKTLCLIRWGQLKVVRREGAVFIIRHHKKNYPLTTLQICESTEALAWLGDFLALDNLYQGYLQTQREELLHDEFTKEEYRLMRQQQGRSGNGDSTLRVWLARGYIAYDSVSGRYVKTEEYLRKFRV